jgi:hypothetical protein
MILIESSSVMRGVQDRIFILRVLFSLRAMQPSCVGDIAAKSVLVIVRQGVTVDRQGATIDLQGAAVDYPSAVVDRPSAIVGSTDSSLLPRPTTLLRSPQQCLPSAFPLHLAAELQPPPSLSWFVIMI